MSQKDVTVQESMERVERVCRATGCKNRFYSNVGDRGGRPRLTCSDACRQNARRKGKAETASDKAQELNKEAQGYQARARELMNQANEAMRLADLCLVVMKVAQSENLWERLNSDFQKVEE